MKKNLWIAVTLACGLALGSLASAKLPAPPAMSDADKAAKAAKAAAGKAKDAESLGKAQDRAVANYRKNKGIVDPKAPAKASAASTSGKK